MNYSLIIDEYRGSNGVITLERTRADGEAWGRYRVKCVRIKYYNSEADARAAYLKETAPKRRKRNATNNKS